MDYRSVILLNKAKEEIGDIWSVCVPSYGRPNAKIFKGLDIYGKELNMHVFIRKGEYNKYKYLEGKGAKIHVLDHVHNIGQTREAILQWAVANRKANIFMLDDDIFELDILTPQTPVETLMLRAYRFEAGYEKCLHPDIFRYWMYMIKHDEYKHILAMTGAGARSVFRDKKYIGHSQGYNSRQIIQCMHLNVRLLMKNRIHFGDTEVVGNEDMALQFDIMNADLCTRMYSDLMYDVPKVGTGEGGCNLAEGNNDIKERYKRYIERFNKNVLGGKEHKGVKVSTNVAGDLPSIKFNWKYWVKRFEETIEIPF